MGLELAARAGFDPRAAITLWKKMDTQGDSSMMPAFLRTHPTNEDRILVLREAIPKVMPLYVAADKQ
jgi:predicted Zn-dependent protease